KVAEEALIEADRRKHEFLATLAHELRNPLAPVRHAVSMLSSPELYGTEALNDIAGVIDRQVTQMAHVIDDLLELPRVARGQAGQGPRPECQVPGPRKVLVVDDNRDAADILVRLLAAHGGEALVAYDGESALRLAEEFGPTAVLLDIGLPRLDG